MGPMNLQVSMGTDCKMMHASVDQSFNFDVSNNGTLRLLRESLGEVNINAQGLQINGTGNRRHDGSPSESNFQVSAKDICEFQVIGAGASSQVKKAVDLRDNRFVALKVMSVLDSSKARQLLNEVRTLCAAEHQGSLVDFHGAYFDVESSQITIVLEYMDAGSLATVLSKAGALPEPVLARVATQVVQGLACLHSKHTMHRDIKPGNILLSYQGVAKVSDFGITAGLENTLAMRDSFIGTMCYMSPERINNHPYQAEADIWSLGVTLFEAATGKYPYKANQGPFDLCIEIAEYPPPRLADNQFSPELVDFVARCLEKEPAQRATAQELLSHPFVLKHRDVPVDVAGFLQALADPLEGLQSYAQLFAAMYYCVLDRRSEGMPTLEHLYQEDSRVSLSGECCEGWTRIAIGLEQHSARLTNAGAGLHHHHRIEKVDAQPLPQGAILVHIVGRVNLMNQIQNEPPDIMVIVQVNRFDHSRIENDL